MRTGSDNTKVCPEHYGEMPLMDAAENRRTLLGGLQRRRTHRRNLPRGAPPPSVNLFAV
ncbi:hypothetical protein SAMN05444158_0556 [Bradyrhizobium canariense]|uniref:Uncharacterized protein n=1 Tax=Bradyrhizobium canariense TaxID=255045 RepID=A0A1H1NB53_9BRAD|nr:hypothetical protein SAMN05444158_0556 [Bradyrhizobium canariense]